MTSFATTGMLTAVAHAHAYRFRSRPWRLERPLRCSRTRSGRSVISIGARHMPTLIQLETAIRTAWCRETSDDPDEWTPSNPARGQCGVTALVVRDYLGGEILIATVIPKDGSPPTERHGWNRLPSGIEIDLTWEQFHAGERLGPAAAREPMIKARAPHRHELLAERVKNLLEHR